jgi:prevent-host-death family protein
MIEPLETGPLTEFTQHTDEAIKRLKETGQPQILTVDGRAEVVVQDVDAYERMLELLDRAEAIEGIRQGLEQMKRGDVRPLDEVIAEIRARNGVVDTP